MLTKIWTKERWELFYQKPKTRTNETQSFFIWKKIFGKASIEFFKNIYETLNPPRKQAQKHQGWQTGWKPRENFLMLLVSWKTFTTASPEHKSPANTNPNSRPTANLMAKRKKKVLCNIFVFILRDADELKEHI